MGGTEWWWGSWKEECEWLSWSQPMFGKSAQLGGKLGMLSRASWGGIWVYKIKWSFIEFKEKRKIAPKTKTLLWRSATIELVFMMFIDLYFMSVFFAAMPSVMERSGAGVLSRSRAKTVTNGNSQPHSEEESSDEEHAHGRNTNMINCSTSLQKREWFEGLYPCLPFIT